MAIKHTEECASVANVDIGNIGVLHGLAPALHAACCKANLKGVNNNAELRREVTQGK